MADLLSVIMIALFAPVFVAAVDDSMTSESTVTKSGDEATSDDDAANDAPSADLGTRDNPAPFGSTVTIKEFGTPTWEVTLGAANLNATANVMAANQFNPDPEPGQVYAIVPATVKYIGSNSATPNFSLQFTYGSADGRSYDGGFVSMEGQLTDVSELYTDAVATGNVVMTIPEAAPETGVWGISYFADDPVFIAIQ